MSQLMEAEVTCPRCAAVWPSPLFSSVDADTIEAQVEAILDGSFERQDCAGCGHAFRPEHPMLFASHARRLWIVMQPPSDRPGFAGIERDVAQMIADSIARAAPAAQRRFAGLQPRLVFGQHMLTEAVRIAWAGIDASLVECAKLLAVRRSLPELVAHGPFELCFERLDDGAPVFAVHALPDGARLSTLALVGDLFAEARAAAPALREQFPDLFDRPYVSATRYLIGDTL